MVKDNKSISQRIHGFLDILLGLSNKFRNLVPSLFQIFAFVDIQSGQKWSNFVPNFLIDFESDFGL